MTKSEMIRNLNDQFRKTFIGGRVMLTQGIVGREDVRDILRKVQTFDAFTADNDSHKEHDFAAFEAGGDTIFWKIDYYDPSLSGGSEDPSCPERCFRVLTILMASEY